MQKIPVYEIYSIEYPYTGEEKIHGLRARWNVPNSDPDSDDAGAVQVWDKIVGDYYRKGITVHAGIREKYMLVDLTQAVLV